MTHCAPARPDRLADLIERFDVAITPVADAPANLVILGDDNGPRSVLFLQKPQAFPSAQFAARVDWGTVENPLETGLPVRIEMPIETPDLMGLAVALKWEAEAHRCGSASVLRRLAEVMIVRLLRFQFDTGCDQIGVLAGLTDLRLSRAIVAMHNRPGHGWTSGDLAVEAGLSPSRFSELFSQKVGQSPMAYLRQWRLTVARQDLQQGQRVDAVSRRYGYASSEAFSRAFRQKYGVPPLAIRGRVGVAPGA
ncbi:helix-turn-helix transcriptional regulator [uncultured Pelagimonas sp.]|uniref:helix-turn-helix transcriptional regulator n=1 Tax=uncultured Pelagimonas sp. TaxID=1618102 RepID=UPI002613707C|nr:helix-turn-helix transcriptional regulator [uncultured Pelagimonas sp.]